MRVAWGGAGGGSPCRAPANTAASNDKDNGHIGNIQADGVVKDDSNDDNLDNDDNKEGEDENGDDNDNNTVISGEAATAASCPDDKDGSNNGNNDKGDVDSNGGGNDDYDIDDVDDDNNDNGTITMQWQRRGWNDDNPMAMGLQALCHPSEATINLC